MSTPVSSQAAPASREFPRITLGVVIITSVLVRILVQIYSHAVIWPDSGLYYEAARAIIKNCDVSSHAMFHTPGYPLFLAIFLLVEPSSILLVAAQHLLGVLTVYFIYCFARELVSEKAALVASMLFSLNPLVLYYESVVQTESFFLFFVALFYLFFFRTLKSQRWSDFAMCGALCACLTLVRPVAQLYAGCVLIVIALAAPSVKLFLRNALLFLIPFLVCLLPWMFVNLSTYGFFGVSKGQGLNLYLRALDLSALAPAPHTKYPEVFRLWSKYHNRSQSSYNFVRFGLQRVYHRSVKDADEQMFGFAVEAIKHSPFKFAREIAREMVYFFSNSHHSVVLCASEYGPYLCSSQKTVYGRSFGPFRNAPAFQNKVFNEAMGYYFSLRYPMTILFILALYGLWVWIVAPEGGHSTPLRRAKIAFIALTLGYFSLITVTFNKPEDRYRLPVDPLIMILAVHGIGRLCTILGSVHPKAG